eukprot:1192107-Prorocentrum_minimum.AAC.1
MHPPAPSSRTPLNSADTPTKQAQPKVGLWLAYQLQGSRTWWQPGGRLRKEDGNRKWPAIVLPRAHRARLQPYKRSIY